MKWERVRESERRRREREREREEEEERECESERGPWVRFRRESEFRFPALFKK